jgi:hypothetical protein
MMRGLVLVMAMAACAQGAELEDPQLAGPFMLHQAEAEPEPVPCGMAFDPAPELLAGTEAAAERWSAATGCDVRVEAGGVPMKAWTSLFAETRPDGHTLLSRINHGGTMRHICGLSTWTEDASAVRIIDVSLPYPGCEDVEWSVAHEMWHALVAVKGHALSGIGASGDSPDKSALIDAASLAAVCSSLPCSVFSPEAP